MATMFKSRLLFIFVMAMGLHAEVIDSIVAKVNSQPIFLSDLERQIRFESLENKMPLPRTKLAYDHDALGRLIDQEILRQQMTGFKFAPVVDAEVQSELKNLEKQITGTDKQLDWQQELAKAGLTESDVAERLNSEITILHFLDARLRPTIRIDRNEMQAYYRETFLPKLEKAGGKRVPFGQVAAEIQQILVQQRMGDAISEWLKVLRSQADVQITPTSNVEAETK